MHIQMNFNLLFFDEHFATRQTHKFRFHNIRLNRMRNFKAHKTLFQIDRIRPRAVKIDMLIQMANQIALRILLRIAKRTGIWTLRLGSKGFVWLWWFIRYGLNRLWFRNHGNTGRNGSWFYDGNIFHMFWWFSLLHLAEWSDLNGWFCGRGYDRQNMAATVYFFFFCGWSILQIVKKNWI